MLDDAELRIVWQAADDLSAPFGGLVKLLILTGQRRDEVAGMRWSELDPGAVARMPQLRKKVNRPAFLGTVAPGA